MNWKNKKGVAAFFLAALLTVSPFSTTAVYAQQATSISQLITESIAQKAAEETPPVVSAVPEQDTASSDAAPQPSPESVSVPESASAASSETESANSTPTLQPESQIPDAQQTPTEQSTVLEERSDGFQFKLSDDGYMVYSYLGTSSEVFIPSQYNGRPVTEIGNNAFFNCDFLTSVTIPNSVTKIQGAAFYACNALKSVTIPASVILIRSSAFAYCYSLKSITIPASVTSITDDTFLNSGLETIYGVPGSYAETFANAKGYQFLPIGEGEPEGTYKQILYFEKWDKESKTAYFKNNTNALPKGFQVTEETNPNLPIDNMQQFLNQYVLVTAKKSQTSIYDVLLNIEAAALEQKVGILESIDTNEIRLSNAESPIPIAGEAVIEKDELTAGNIVIVYTHEGKAIAAREMLPQQGYLLKADANGKKAIIEGVEYIVDDTLHESVKQLYSAANMGKKLSYWADQERVYRVNILEETMPEVGDFNEYAYRANHFENPENYLYTQSLYTDLAAKTPGDLYREAFAEDQGFNNAVDIWKSSTTALDLIENAPGTMYDLIVEKKDMYSALIFNSLKSIGENNSESKLESITTGVWDIIKSLDSAGSGIVEGGIFVADVFKDMPEEEKEKVAETVVQQMEKNPIFKKMDSIKDVDALKFLLSSVNNVSDFYKILSQNIYLTSIAEEQKEVVEKMLELCPESKPSLRSALQECLKTMNRTCEETMRYTALIYGFEIFAKEASGMAWEILMKSIENPLLKSITAGYAAGKAISNVLTNTDALTENYYKLVAIEDLRALCVDALNHYKSAYQNNPTPQTAQTYLAAIDTFYGFLQGDCMQAYDFVDGIDQSGLTKVQKALASLFGDSDNEVFNYQKMKESIQAIQDDYNSTFTSNQIVWVQFLPEDYPNTGLYEYYEAIMQKRLQNMVKQVKVACPVNVKVFDQNNNVVASVIDGRLSSAANISVELDGETKIFSFYDQEQYRTEIEGYAAGTMDVAVIEYDDQEQEKREVVYQNIPVADGQEYSMELYDKIQAQPSYELKDENGQELSKDLDTSDVSNQKLYRVQMENGMVTSKESASSTAEYYAGQTVSIAVLMSDNQEFVRWQATGDVKFANEEDAATSFVMPKGDVTIRAVLTEKTTSSDVTTDVYEMDGNLVLDVKTGSTVEEIKKVFTSQSELVVLNAAGKDISQNTGASVGTGCRVGNIYSDVNTADDWKVIVVYGDLNGDAQVGTIDFLQLRRYMLLMDDISKKALCYLRAATPVSKNPQEPTTMDLLQMRRYLLGMEQSMTK